MKIFNRTLLIKWNWKIKPERNGLWFNVLLNRYMSIEVLSGITSNYGSKWWKMVCKLESGEWENSSFFSIKEAYKDFFYLVSLTLLILYGSRIFTN